MTYTRRILVEDIDEKDVDIAQLKNEVYRFIQKSKDSDTIIKYFKFKIRKRIASLSPARSSIIAIIIRKKLNLHADDHIEIVDDSEGE